MCRDGDGRSKEYVKRTTSTEVEVDEEPVWNDAVTVEDDIRRIQAHVFRRRIRTRPFFVPFDPLRAGRCSRTEFIRALSGIIEPDCLNDSETPIDSEALADRFIDPATLHCEPQVVNYSRFCEIMDSVFVIPHLEKNPQIDVDKACTKVLDAGGFVPRNMTQDEAALEVLNKIAYLTQQRGINIHTCFDTHSRRPVDIRVGRIEPRDFVRLFPLAQSTPTKPAALTEDDMQLLVDRYRDDNGFVRLMPFEKDIVALIEQYLHIDEEEFPAIPDYTCTMSTKWFPLKPPPSEHRPQSARRPIQSLQESVCKQRPQSARSPQSPLSYGSSGPMSHGTVTSQRPQSAKILGTTRAKADQVEQYRFPNTFSNEPSEVASGMSDFDQVESIKSPQENFEQAWSSQRFPQRPHSARAIRHDQERFGEKSAFASQRPQSAKTSRPIRNHEQTSVKPFGLSRPSKPPTPMQSRNPHSARQIVSPSSVIEKIIKFCFERRLRLFDVFKDSDTLRKGVINRTQMCTALAVLGISLSPNELDILFNAFATADDMFRYPDCTAIVEEAVTKATFPTSDNVTGSDENLLDQNDQTYGVMDQEKKQALLQRIETAIAVRLHSRRLNILATFDDHSRAHWAMPGHVTETQCVRIMKNLEIEVTDKDLNMLLEQYCDSEKNEFNYVKFCKNLDKRLTTFRQSRVDASSLSETPKHGTMAFRFANPYYDKAGRVRPLGSRPNSAQTWRPLQGTGVQAAGWRPGAFIGRHVTNCSI